MVSMFRPLKRPQSHMRSGRAIADEKSLCRLFPFEVTVSALTLGFLILILVLIAQRMLLPGIVIIGSFILFVLWLTGLVETSIQLFGPNSSVNTLCNTYVNGQSFSGVSLETLAWLEQKNICEYHRAVLTILRTCSVIANADVLGNCWDAAYAFEVVGVVFLLWMMVMAYQVNRDEYD